LPGPPTGAELVIEARSLHYRYPDGTPALRSVDLEVRRGERWGVIGSNGSGKSTLLHHCAGVHPAPGHLWVLGIEATRAQLREIRRRVGFLFQDPDDQLFLPTVREDVAFGPRNAGLPEVEVGQRVERALARLELTHLADRPTHRLSGGEKQGVAIATVLALEPEILLLDEPTNDLDPGARRRLIGFLRDWGGTIMIATHDLEFLLETVDRVLLVDGGTSVVHGAVREILGDRERLERYQLEEPPSLRVLRALRTEGQEEVGPVDSPPGAT